MEVERCFFFSHLNFSVSLFFVVMAESLAYWVDFFSKNEKVFYFVLVSLCILCLFLIYVLIAFFFHRKDRKELEQIAISKKVDVIFKYSWRGVELEIRHPTDHSKETPPTQGDQPPSPSLGDSAGEVKLYSGGTHAQREKADNKSSNPNDGNNKAEILK